MRSHSGEETRSGRVLIVDDEAAVRSALGGVLRRAGYDCQAVANISGAHGLLERSEFELVLCDLRLPGESGVAFLEQLLRTRSDTAAMAITARDDPQLAARLFGLGSYGYLVKPFSPSQLLIGVAGALTRRQRDVEKRREQERLEAALDRYSRELSSLEGAADSSGQHGMSPAEAIRFLARAQELHSGYTGKHSERVGTYCSLIARAIGLTERRCEQIGLASQLHDLGKLAVPDRVLLKPGPLTAEERAAVERHAELGHEILASSSSELLRLAATIALTHHERFDGHGYPHRLAGEAIPLEGRIAAIADTFDALTSDRPYRRAVPVEEAFTTVVDEAGRAFDPTLVSGFSASFEELLAVTQGTDRAESRRCRNASAGYAPWEAPSDEGAAAG